MRGGIRVALAGIAAALLVVLIWGSRLPREHTATVRARFRETPEVLWAAITDLEAAPAWRSDLKRAERLPEQDGKPVWLEVGKQGSMTMVWDVMVAPSRLVARIADDKLPFGGSWTYVLQPTSGGCTLTITEKGEIKPAIFRFVGRYIMGYDRTMKQYILDLGKKFNDPVMPDPVD